MTSKPIPYGCQDIQDSDVASVIQVLQSDYLIVSAVPKFEQVVVNLRYKDAVAVNSATSALHIALMALDIGTMILFGAQHIRRVIECSIVLWSALILSILT